MLDVTVKLLRAGIIVNSNKDGRKFDDMTATLGIAMLGKMKLGGN